MTGKRTAKTTGPTPVESIRHQQTRKNIPTEELRDFVADDERAPKTMLYPRDPSLDPQLFWQGKDAQDRADLAVPVVPIYIQEKIQPQALIDDLLAQAARQGDGVAKELCRLKKIAIDQVNAYSRMSRLRCDPLANYRITCHNRSLHKGKVNSCQVFASGHTSSVSPRKSSSRSRTSRAI